MFISRLDRPWLETPFLVQGFLVRTESEISQLKKHSKQVQVDIKRSTFRFSESAISALSGNNFSESVSSANDDRQYTRAGIINSLPSYKATAKTLRFCQKAFKTNSVPTSQAVETTVSRTYRSVLDDRSAISWLTRVKSHNGYLAEHSMHVSMLAMLYGSYCQWSEYDIKQAGTAGLLFDIGNVRIPKAILQKPQMLAEAEWQLIRQHPKWSRYYIEKSGFNREIAEAAYFHHERVDGSGYPVNKVGSSVPRLARLIHVLDAYDAMISPRPYATQKTVYEALRTLYRGRGVEFDSDIVDQFIEMIGVYPVGTIVELSSGEVAVVIGNNKKSALLPKVAVMRDRNKEPMNEALIDLTEIVDTSGRQKVSIRSMLNDGSYGLYMRDYTRQLLQG